MKYLVRVITDRFKITPNSAIVAVRLTPRASIDKVEGWHDGDDGKSYLKARVRALPDKGKANQALINLLAKWLGVPKKEIKLLSGSKSRLKMVEIGDNRGVILEQLKQV